MPVKNVEDCEPLTGIHKHQQCSPQPAPEDLILTSERANQIPVQYMYGSSA
jgi:hypothetical protein